MAKDRPPYEHWTTFLRQNAHDPRAVLPFVALPPHVPREGEGCIAEQVRYVEAATRLTDRWGSVSVYEADCGDWFDEQ